MSIKDDVSVSNTHVVLQVLKHPKIARVYKPEEVGELIEALVDAAEQALDNRLMPMKYDQDCVPSNGKNGENKVKG